MFDRIFESAGTVAGTGTTLLSTQKGTQQEPNVKSQNLSQMRFGLRMVDKECSWKSQPVPVLVQYQVLGWRLEVFSCFCSPFSRFPMFQIPNSKFQ